MRICNEGHKARSLYSVISMIVFVGLILTGCTEDKNSKVYRVGVISGAPFFATTVDGFKFKMEELGYTERKNIIYEVHTVSTNDVKATEKSLNKLVGDKVELIFAFPTGSALKAKAATRNSGIPVVFSGATLEGNNLVESAREPEENITGVRAPTPDMSVKQLEILLRKVPKLKSILLLHNPNYVPSVEALAALREAAGPIIGVGLVVKSITSVEVDQGSKEFGRYKSSRGIRRDISNA